MSGSSDARPSQASRWPPTGRDLVALITVIVALAALIVVGVGLEAAHRAKLAHDRAAAEAKAAGPKRAPPITSSVYVRTVPIRRAG